MGLRRTPFAPGAGGTPPELAGKQHKRALPLPSFARLPTWLLVLLAAVIGHYKTA